MMSEKQPKSHSPTTRAKPPSGLVQVMPGACTMRPLGRLLVFTPRPPCPANNKVLKKYGPNRSVRRARRSVRDILWPETSVLKPGASFGHVPKKYGRDGSVRWTPHSLDTRGGGGGRALLEGEGCDWEKFQSGCRAVTGDVKRLGGYWRLEMRLGLVLGYGNAFGVESGPECWGGGGNPPPLQAIPCGWVGGWARWVGRILLLRFGHPSESGVPDADQPVSSHA